MESNDDVVDEIVHQAPATARRTVLLIERGHREGPGVPRETLDGYVDALAERRDFSVDAEDFAGELEAALVDEDEWVAEDRLYRLDGDRISRYPARWHRELGGSDDVAAFVDFLEETAFADSVGRSGASRGIDEEALLDVVAAVGRIPIDEAKARLETLREEGVLVEDADQHPHAGVYLAAEASELRDPALDDS
jgi:hypothetical protein